MINSVRGIPLTTLLRGEQMAKNNLHECTEEVKKMNQELSNGHNIAGAVTVVFTVVMLAFAL